MSSSLTYRQTSRDERPPDTVHISQTNYNKCVKVLNEQDARIKILESQLLEKDRLLAERSAGLERFKDVRPKADEEAEVDYKERCRLLTGLLNRHNVDIGAKLERSRLEEIIPRLEAELRSKDALIKDLKHSLEETEGGNAERYSEARIKNDRLERTIRQKEELLVGHQNHIEELEKVLKDKAASELTASRWMSAGGVCDNCQKLEARITTMTQENLILRKENDNLKAGREVLTSENSIKQSKIRDLKSINKDLRCCLEGKGDDKDMYQEARLKNFHLQKLINQTQNQLAGYQLEIEDLNQKVLGYPIMKKTIDNLRAENEALKMSREELESRIRDLQGSEGD